MGGASAPSLASVATAAPVFRPRNGILKEEPTRGELEPYRLQMADDGRKLLLGCLKIITFWLVADSVKPNYQIADHIIEMEDQPEDYRGTIFEINRLVSCREARRAPS